MKLTRVSAKDKSIGGVTNGVKWRYIADIGEMDVPEKVGVALIATGDFEAVKAAPKDKGKAKHVDTTADGILVLPTDGDGYAEPESLYQDSPGHTWPSKGKD